MEHDLRIVAHVESIRRERRCPCADLAIDAHDGDAARREVGPIGVVHDVTVRGEQRDRVVHLRGVVLVLEQLGDFVRRSRSIEQRGETLVQPAREYDRRSLAE